MIRCRITKIESNHDNLRSDIVEGFCVFMPEVGQPFVMYSEPLTSMARLRMIRTSVVVEMLPYGFKTLNSEYLFNEIVG